MATSRDRSDAGGSTVLVSAMAGAVLGAAGLAWWLLSEADRRRREQRQGRLLRLSRLQEGSAQEVEATALPEGAGQTPRLREGELHDRVQQITRAIEDVRRQLEQLQTQP